MDRAESEAIDEKLEWGVHINMADKDVKQNPTGSYNAVSEALRQNFPHEATCSMFCGGKKCKYCCADNWKNEEQAIKGLYSHWVTDNILAMSRPITEYVEKFEVIKQFNAADIKAIINTQLPGEHASCGNGVHDNEFSYQQKTFMDNGVFFYNFGWPDFGVTESMSSLLDMVKVMQYALSEGKVAVHCHAGKGRTGVLIACFLVFHNRMTANEAVYYVRSRRPNSVQTTPQVKCVQQFESYLKPLRVVFSSQAEMASFNLEQYLLRQKALLHGYQARKLKNLPKIIHVICEALLKIAKKEELLHITSPSFKPGAHKLSTALPQSVGSDSDDPIPSLKRNSHPHHRPTSNGIHGSHGKDKVTKEVLHIGHALTTENITAELRAAVDKHKENLNSADSAWDDLRAEKNPAVMSTLLWEWLDQLKDPIVRRQDFHILYENIEQPQNALNRLEKGVRCTLTYLMEFLVKLQPITEELECEVIQSLVKNITHQTVCPALGSMDQSVSAEDLHASVNTLTNFYEPNRLDLFRFFYNLLEVVEDEVERKQSNNAQ